MSLILAVIGVLLLHLSSNVYNDYFDVKDGTDEGNNDYFQPGGASISGGSRSIELGIITLKKTKKVAKTLMMASILVASLLFYNIYLLTGSVVNIQGSLFVGLFALFLGYFYTATPLRLVSRKGIGELCIFLAFGMVLRIQHIVFLAAIGFYFLITKQIKNFIYTCFFAAFNISISTFLNALSQKLFM